MSVSTLSFWKQDQGWLTSQQNWSAQLSGANLASASMAQALSTKSKGIAALYNQQALTRVTQQFQTAATAALKSQSGSSASSSSTAFSPSATSAGYGPSTPSLGILTSYAPALQSAGTAATLLTSVTNASFATGGLVSILT
jgi:hypothetical protein